MRPGTREAAEGDKGDKGAVARPSFRKPGGVGRASARGEFDLNRG
ncbi:hypothetical protein GCM10010140_41100 [Streptosporangium pseudovulgare]|uniref:Uncharacterized protein n=1 Tax=Streptosporangium pseudovulgare TaxID=35765 RepID=A0ABQ2R355_9ACTN|nr:hypothetical protein GCM10010140_41100 [Streptosporangium pseudovulgare]